MRKGLGAVKRAAGTFAGAPVSCVPEKLYMVGIAQLAEHRIVVPGVVGSSPITHPILVAEGRSVRSGLWLTAYTGV